MALYIRFSPANNLVISSKHTGRDSLFIYTFASLLVFPCTQISEFLLWALKFIPCKMSLLGCGCQVCKIEFVLVRLVGWMCYFTWILNCAHHFNFLLKIFIKASNLYAGRTMRWMFELHHTERPCAHNSRTKKYSNYFVRWYQRPDGGSKSKNTAWSVQDPSMKY